MTQSCEQCCAVHEDGADCLSCFHALLAYENQRPTAFGAVHHLTVAAYYLQHPAGYTHEALAHWREILAKSLDDGATIRELRQLSGQRFAGSKRVREDGASAPNWWPRTWPTTIQRVVTPDVGTNIDVETYVQRARDWARDVRRALDEAQRTTTE